MTPTTITHEIPPVWNSESRILILGTMPSPASRDAGFFYMHPQNRFWKVVATVFGEDLKFSNSDAKNPGLKSLVIQERRNFLLRHKTALWDVLSSCDINGASDASIKNAVPNDFTKIFTASKITKVFFTGKTAYNLWNKFCAEKYETQFNLKTECLPSTSPANATWTFERLVKIYRKIAETV